MFGRRTRPGDVLGSRGFEIMFVAGHQLGVGSYIVEYEMDWTALMEIVLEVLEEGNNLAKNIHTCLTNIISYHTKDVLNDTSNKVKVEADISDENYFLSKQARSLYIRIVAGASTSLHFFIRRKQILRSLKELAVHAVTDRLKENSKIEELEIPRTLRQEVGQVVEYWWVQMKRPRQRLNYIQPRMMSRDVSWRAANFVENVDQS